MIKTESVKILCDLNIEHRLSLTDIAVVDITPDRYSVVTGYYRLQMRRNV